MNCGVCIAFLRVKNSCCGCKNEGNKPKHCTTCRIINCDYLDKDASLLCIDCKKFPCRRMKQLDARYRKSYNTSLIENLTEIQENGIEKFLEAEFSKWTCPICNTIKSIHRGSCLNCKPKTIEENE